MTPEQNDHIFAEAQALARDAYWYANGRNDERRGQPAGVTLDYVDPFDFSRHFGKIAQAQLRGETNFRPSIQDAFAAYAA